MDIGVAEFVSVCFLWLALSLSGCGQVGTWALGAGSSYRSLIVPLGAIYSLGSAWTVTQGHSR